MTLKELNERIIALADLKYKANKNYDECLSEATKTYLRLCKHNFKYQPSWFKMKINWN